MTIDQQVKVLFVCMGNICRSPTAQGVFGELLAASKFGQRIDVDSAGTHAYHVGHPPDERSTATALGHGVDMRDQRARQVTPQDLRDFDYVLAMDQSNLEVLEFLHHECGGRARVGLLLEYAPDTGLLAVPDPYYGGDGGFERVYDLIEAGCQGLLAALEKRLAGT